MNPLCPICANQLKLTGDTPKYLCPSALCGRYFSHRDIDLHQQNYVHREQYETVLNALESMARQNCYTDKNKETDSGAISADAEALEVLAAAGRFTVTKSSGRMICGYWPENKPKE